MWDLSGLAADLRYMRDLVPFLRRPLTLDLASARITDALATREAKFLDILDRAVYAQPLSPYKRLLDHAGITLADLQRDVRSRGIEATLQLLYDAGVYVTSEEIKGRKPIIRGRLKFDVSIADFDNPLLQSAHMVSRSSGSTGKPVSVRLSLESSAGEAINVLVGNVAQFQGRPMTYWGSALFGLLWYLKAGCEPARIYFSQWPNNRLASLRLRFMMRYIRFVSARFGRPLPPITIVPRDQAFKIAEWLAEMSRLGTPAAIVAHANPAVRICLSAAQRKLDISGTTFFVTGEPLTAGKLAVIRHVGASAIAQYSMVEAGGLVALGCGRAEQPDDMHVFTNKLALIQVQRNLAPHATVGALLYTTLDPTAPKLLLNFDSGDYAFVSQRVCDCVMGRVGLNTHVSEVRSYEKLTSEGVSFVGTRLYQLVEEILPARFGGDIGDYQIAEEEHEDGLSRISIVVAPSVGHVDEPAVIDTVMRALQATHSEPGGDEMLTQWNQASSLEVVRREPYSYTGAKVLPLTRSIPRSRRP